MCCSTGWLSSWGEAMAYISFQPPSSSPDPYQDPKFFIGALNAILRFANNSGNVNFYMAFGGTNFGWWQGGLATAAAEGRSIPAPCCVAVAGLWLRLSHPVAACLMWCFWPGCALQQVLECSCGHQAHGP